MNGKMFYGRVHFERAASVEAVTQVIVPPLVPSFEPRAVRYAEREQVMQLRRIGRRLYLRAERERRHGDDELRKELSALSRVTEAEAHATVRTLTQLNELAVFDKKQTLERLQFLAKRVGLLERVGGFLCGFALLLAVALVALLLSGCSGPAFVAGDVSSSSGAPSSAPAGGAMEPDKMSTAGAGDRAGTSAGGVSGGSGGSSSAGVGASGSDAGAGGEALSSVPCDRNGWRASAWAEFVDGYGGPAQLALDGDDHTRWTGGAAQLAGQWFAVDFGQQLELERVTVRAVQVPSDAPKLLQLELDGEPTPATLLELRPGELQLELERTRAATRLRLVLLAERASWWSIDELTGDCR